MSPPSSALLRMLLLRLTVYRCAMPPLPLGLRLLVLAPPPPRTEGDAPGWPGSPLSDAAMAGDM